MSYPLPQNAPTIIANGRKFALGAFEYDNFISIYMVAVFEEKPEGWNEVGKFTVQTDPARLLETIASVGGIINFLNKVVRPGLAEELAAIDMSPPSTSAPPTSEPATYLEAEEMIGNFVNGLKINFVNGKLGLAQS